MAFQSSPDKCLVCRKGDNLLFKQDYKNNSGIFSLYECQSCFIQFWVPFKNPGSEWYERGGTYKPGQLLKPKITRAYHREFIKRYGSLKDKRILDVGCGMGEFLHELQRMGWKVWGVDFDHNAINAAKLHFDLKTVYAMSLGEFFKTMSAQEFDFITCFEVIEHIDNPKELIETISDKLSFGGSLVVSTPSRERSLLNLNPWDFPPNHLTRWSKEALVKLFSLNKFRLERIVFVEGFRIILESINGRYRFGLVAKAQGLQT